MNAVYLTAELEKCFNFPNFSTFDKLAETCSFSNLFIMIMLHFLSSQLRIRIWWIIFEGSRPVCSSISLCISCLKCKELMYSRYQEVKYSCMVFAHRKPWDFGSKKICPDPWTRVQVDKYTSDPSWRPPRRGRRELKKFHIYPPRKVQKWQLQR